VSDPRPDSGPPLDPRDVRPLLVVVAVGVEARGLLPQSADAPLDANDEQTPDDGWPAFDVGDGVRLVVSGIGRVNAAGATAQEVVRARTGGRRFEGVVNLGVAGALPGSGLVCGDVVVGSAARFVEEGIVTPEGIGDVVTLGFPLGPPRWAVGNVVRGIDDTTMHLHLRDRLEADLAADDGSGFDESARIVVGPIATVACCSGTDAAAAAVRSLGSGPNAHPIAEAMEGAAVIATARRFGLPAWEIRVISNTCGDRDRQVHAFGPAFARLAIVARAVLGSA